MTSSTHPISPDLVPPDAKVGFLSPDLSSAGLKELPLVADGMAKVSPCVASTSYASAVKSNSQTTSFSAATTRTRLVPRFKTIDLPSRQYSTIDGKPSVHFTAAEFEAGVALFKHSLVAKFTMGRPTIEVIRQVFKENWHIKGRATVSDIWDSRHLMIILDSEEDANAVLTSPLRKIGHAMFRLFRYSTDYSPRMESSTTTKWVRLPGIHPGFVTRNYVASIVNSFGYFLDLDERSKACATLRFVRACVELDVCNPIPDEVRISLSDGRVFWQKVEVEGNLAYCSHCKVHGHELSICRKKHGTKNYPKEQVSTIIQKEHKSVEITIQNDSTNQKKIPAGSQEEWVQVRKKKSARKVRFTNNFNSGASVPKQSGHVNNEQGMNMRDKRGKADVQCETVAPTSSVAIDSEEISANLVPEESRDLISSLGSGEEQGRAGFDPDSAVVLFKEKENEESKKETDSSTSKSIELGLPKKSILRKSDTMHPNQGMDHLASRMARLKALNGNSDDGRRASPGGEAF
ncbi:hypothetical protein QQ045_024030 [Rhodiola kirilowii]